ncbi:MAG: TIGR03668 family PPOX class F420-dependent oxidoreductase [Chloroflexota bacterium]|nr:TIGR03668 family PPOX class F420-dependent oxidoreductase [Chloroflexota bacterium]
MVVAPDGPPLELLTTARTATLATISTSGVPRLVPVCFAAVADPDAEQGIRVYSPLDEKPKRVSDPTSLARVRDIAADPRVSMLLERWSEDWSALAWLRLEGLAVLVEPETCGTEHSAAVTALRERYPQYRGHELETRPLIRITPLRVTDWNAAEPLAEDDD